MAAARPNSPAAAKDSVSDPSDETVDDKVWTSGDVEIISSDGVRFRVPSYHLRSSSPVMKAKLDAMGTSFKSITLSNREFETAATLRQYLSLLTSGELTYPVKEDSNFKDSTVTLHLALEHPVKSDDFLALLPLTLFLREYKCKVLLSAFLLCVHEHMRSGLSEPICAFAVGAVAEHEGTMALALRRFSSTWEPVPNGSGFAGATARATVFDPAHWPLSLWHAIPTSVTWALARAFKDMGASQGLTAHFSARLSWVIADQASDDMAFRRENDTARWRCEKDKCAWVEEDQEWTSGDFELITADCVRFQVPSYYLFARSVFFRDAHILNGDKNKTITFTDSDFETAPTLRRFLCLITTGRIPLSKRPEAKIIRPLISFLRKYDCSDDLNILLVYLHDRANEGLLCPVFAFIAGATADNPHTCEVSLRNTKETLEDMTGTRLSVWDPYSIRASQWRCIPTIYLWALCKAWASVGRKPSTKLSTEFAMLITISRTA